MTGLPSAALEAFITVSNRNGDLPRLIYDPPYKHQSDAIRCSLIDGKNLIVMTGTGSGKTEAFLLPILGKFAREAKSSPSSFGQDSAMRALILYPMNALVNDQLGRLRALFGDPRLVNLFKNWAGRPPRFARYTSRTPYAGIRTPQKDTVKLKSFDDFYANIERQAKDDERENQNDAQQLLIALKERGKWPATMTGKSSFNSKPSQSCLSKSWNRRAIDVRRRPALNFGCSPLIRYGQRQDDAPGLDNPADDPARHADAHDHRAAICAATRRMDVAAGKALSVYRGAFAPTNAGAPVRTVVVTVSGGRAQPARWRSPLGQRVVPGSITIPRAELDSGRRVSGEFKPDPAWQLGRFA